MRFLKSYKSVLILILSVIIGCVLGLVFKEDTVILKPFGDVFLNMMYTIVVPLVFFSISSSIASMVDMKRLGKIIKYMFLVFIITGIIASLVMLVVLFFVDPVGNTKLVFETTNVESANIGERIVAALTVTDFSHLLSRSNMLPLIIFSILFGFSTSLLKKEGTAVAKFLDGMSKVMMKVVKIIMYYAPIGLCAYFAVLIGEFGSQLLGSYVRSALIYYPVCIIYFIIFYTLYAYLSAGKFGVKKFYQKIMPTVVTSLATQSSLATLPTNLEVAEEIGVPDDIRKVTLPIGATAHMEGSSLAAILKIVFLFSVFNRPFTGIDTYLIAILIATLSGVVMSGIPGGGLIGEMLIVSLYGFPLEAFPLIATIGWIVDPPATCLNVTGDITSSMLMTRIIEGKNWLKKKIFNN